MQSKAVSILHLYLYNPVPLEPDIVLNDDFTLAEQSLNQPGNNIEMESEYCFYHYIHVSFKLI